MNPIESLQALLAPSEFERLAAMIAGSPPKAIVSMWIDRVGAAVLVVKIDGELVFHLLIYAPDADTGEAIACDLEAQLARNFAAMRDAAAAARLLLKRIAGSGDGE
jgi:hypothetical protein